MSQNSDHHDLHDALSQMEAREARARTMPKKRADLDDVRLRVGERRQGERMGSVGGRDSFAAWEVNQRKVETTDMLQQLADEVAYWRALALDAGREDAEP